MKFALSPVTLNSVLAAAILGSALLLSVFQTPAALAIISLSIITVVLIVFGDDLERRVTRQATTVRGGWSQTLGTAVLSREAMLPVGLVLGLLGADYVQPRTINTVAADKLDIVFLVLSFSIIAQGIKHSGYFKYSAYRVLEVCDGQMTRMTLYLFCLCSVLTFVTSNDIVILVLTPIVVEICRQARIRNARLLLLGQFVAANTLSMGLLIGSPTNIIVASETGLDFFSYLGLMLIPSVLAVATGFLVLHQINMASKTWLKAWRYDEYYAMPALKEQPDFTNEMRGWIIGFIAVLVGVSIISHYQLTFFWVTIPAALASLAILGIVGRNHSGESAPPLQQCLKDLPYQIFFFAIAFFIVAEALTDHLNFEAILRFLTSGGLWSDSFLSMTGFGLLVNVVNDLPASAIAGKIALGAPALEGVEGNVFMQSMLVALNIGCYVTPVGALAGIIWFHIMRDANDVETPTRLDMVLFGSVHFLASVLVLSVLIPFTNLAIEWLTAPGNITGPGSDWLLTSGCFLTLAVFGLVLIILRHQNVRLLDMRAFLSAASWVTVRSRQSGILFHTAISFSIVALFMLAIWHLEGDPRAGTEKINSIGDFVIWCLIFLGSGWEAGWFPESRFAKIIAGTMPIIAVLLIVRTLRAVPTEGSLETISRRIGRGEIITRRCVFLGYQHWMRPLIRKVWRNKNRLRIFQTVLYADHRPPAAWIQEPDYDDIYTERVVLDNYESARMVVHDFRVEKADEVYLLGPPFEGRFGRQWVGVVVDEIANSLLNSGEDGTETASERETRAKRFVAINHGQDPEDHAGRLPRIVIWSDADPGDDIAPEMRKLLILLPGRWRKDLVHEEETRDKLSAKLVEAMADTAVSKSWRERKEKIQAVN